MKTRYIKHSLWMMAMAIMMVLTSCHTTKKVTGSLTGPNPEKARFEAVVKSNYKYDALQSKVKLSMGKAGLNGKMCLESGKRFALSANAPLLGFEIGRIEATPDSVVLVDKYDKLYCVVSLAEVTKIKALAGHEMEALECLMLGRIFIPGVGVATAKDYSRLAWNTPLLADGSQGNSQATFDGGDYRLVYSIDSNGQLVSTSLWMPDGKNATWKYSGYQEVEKQKVVSCNEEIHATDDKGKTLSAGLTISNPSFGESSWKAFEPTSSYRKVTLKELGEVLKKLM